MANTSQDDIPKIQYYSPQTNKRNDMEKFEMFKQIKTTKKLNKINKDLR